MGRDNKLIQRLLHCIVRYYGKNTNGDRVEKRREVQLGRIVAATASMIRITLHK
jgi:hypothetical protein